MATDTNHNKSAADLQHEIDMQRNRVEDTIDQIQDRLSPGQLVDEFLAYTKGGGEFVSTLQRQVTSNPLPVALLGVSLAWLMAKPANGHAVDTRADQAWDRSINRHRGYGTADADEEEYGEYPVTVISGTSLRRVGQTKDDRGRSFTSFADDAGKNFKALTDESGKRAGHFIDESGNRFKGFTNAAGERIEHFRDETGNMLDEAAGWASHSWRLVRDAAHGVKDGAAAQASAGRHGAGQAASAIQHQAGHLNQMIMTQFRDQPMVGGALAFALGAALGSSLPHTAQEDEVMGKQADAVKDRIGDAAADLYEEGKYKASEAYEEASGKAGEAYERAKADLAEAVDKAPTGRDGSSTGTH
ncbi:DUF3618 domain-containing protein [Devosia salina]|uniref:DUF3618 domain-containing protein n=1 Tax=Devosia salina TaxID=2860336 RepID=A0ABX8WDK3_9HYPH|nr:DUF3618 domain-containing protein [Devosia salina]QYO76066.1 DUF3618 domain-containing protein [Devosia salina]